MQKAGFIALVGEANAGKSTLLNAILGRKISIVSSKPHTTRNRILGVKRTESAEFVFVDTPGFPTAGAKNRVVRSELARHLNRTLQDAASEVDVVVLVIDATKIGKEEPRPERLQRFAESLRSSLRSRELRSPDVIVLNKVDLLRKDYLLPFMEILYRVFSEERREAKGDLAILPLSALKDTTLGGEGVQSLLSILQERLPEGESLFPEDMDTDQSEQFFAAEIIREKLFQNLHEEVPQGVAVCVERWRDEGEKLFIDAMIIVERESQKPIVLGKGGSMIKKIGESARHELESRFETHIMLKLFVKVEENWSRSARGLERVGM